MSRSDTGGQQHLAPSRTGGLLLGSVFVAAFFHGMLASGLNRTLVDMPAWQRVGAPAWAEFSCRADMGTAGLILYPLEGIGGAVLSILAAIVFHLRRRSMPREANIPIDAAALLCGGQHASQRQESGCLAASAERVCVLGWSASGLPVSGLLR